MKEENVRIADERLVKLTETAIKKIVKLLERENGMKYVRITVTGGGCSGLNYDLKLVDAIDPMDLVVNVGPLWVVVDAKSALYVKGMTLDYSKKMVGGGFKFLNPNAKTSCSCGESFSI
ncbi:[Fe-S]-binding protein [Opitutia bacterium SCGC AG-212-L18]|nr:[Fe-S]-binding protein [Opitutae bacterium SCGC AG-212-L18]